MQRSPPAFVAMLPPIVDHCALAGSGGKNRPRARAAASRSAVTTPASTSARRLSTSMSRMRFIASREMTRPPGYATAPPERPVPAPRTETRMPRAFAHARAVDTSSVEVARATAIGSPSGCARELSPA